VGKTDKLLVRIDEQTTNYSLSELKTILNRGAHHYYTHFKHNPVVSVEARNSKTCRLTQVSDLITGAIRTIMNYQSPGVYSNNHIGPAKIDMANYVCDKFGVRQSEITPPFSSTPFDSSSFSIWHFKLNN
jgi:hypothetical protein